MELADVQEVLSKIHGATFASLDAVTYPYKGVRKVTLGEGVMLFTNKHFSGYEAMVRRRLIAAGKNPDNFVLSDLPWGQRLPNSPLIVHKDKYYLQTVLLTPGETHYYIGEREVDPTQLGLRQRRTSQGLPKEDEVIVLTYALANIVRLRILGEEIVST